jgi:hypothetical protein
MKGTVSMTNTLTEVISYQNIFTDQYPRQQQGMTAVMRALSFASQPFFDSKINYSMKNKRNLIGHGWHPQGIPNTSSALYRT